MKTHKTIILAASVVLVFATVGTAFASASVRSGFAGAAGVVKQSVTGSDETTVDSNDATTDVPDVVAGDERTPGSGQAEIDAEAADAADQQDAADQSDQGDAVVEDDNGDQNNQDDATVDDNSGDQGDQGGDAVDDDQGDDSSPADSTDQADSQGDGGQND